MSISSAIATGYSNVMKASDQLNADKLSNRLVEAGYNLTGGRAGGYIASAIGVLGSTSATTLLWNNMNPVDTIFREMPKAVAEQNGFVHQAIEVAGKGLEALAETFVIGLTANFALQSVDSAVDMVKATRKQSLHLKDA